MMKPAFPFGLYVAALAAAVNLGGCIVIDVQRADATDNIDAGVTPMVTPDATLHVDAMPAHVVATIPVGMWVLSMVVEGNEVWLSGESDSDTGLVEKINLETHAVDGSFMTAPVASLAERGAAIAMTDQTDGTVSLIDPNTDAITPIASFDPTMFTINDPVFDGNFLWIANYTGGDEVLKLDPNTGEVLDRISFALPGVGDSYGAMLFDGTNLWIAGPYQYLTKIDPVNGVVLDQLELSTSGFFAFDGSNLWVDQFGQIAKIDPNTDATVAEIDTGFDCYGVAAADGYIWMAGLEISQADGRQMGVLVIDPATDSIATLIQGGDVPTDIVFDGQRIIVSNLTTNAISIIQP